MSGQTISPDMAVFGAVFFCFMGIFFFTLAAFDFLRRRRDIRKRALVDIDAEVNFNGSPEAWHETTLSLRSQNLASTSALLGAVERRVEMRESESSKLRKDLLKAGYFSESALLWYQGIRLSLTVIFAMGAGVALSLFMTQASVAMKILCIIAAAGMGFTVPSRYISWRQAQMYRQCEEGFPDFMDLMVIAAEAGLSPRAAIDRISRELSKTHPYLGANLYLASLELRAGNSLQDALVNLGKRTELPEVINLASLLQQSEKFGTSITDTLRVYSEEMREKRLLRAEEKAHSLPVKLVIPLGIYVFPVMLIVILLPVVVRIRGALL
jgi:tight adherence protein C